MAPRARARLTQVTGAGSITNSYNGLGQRVRKQTAAATTRFFYDEAGRLLGEYTNTGGLIQELVWLEELPVASLRPKSGGGVEIYYVHADHLGTPRVITTADAQARIVWRWDSDPFGAAPANEDPDGDGAAFAFNLRFPGQYLDRETGLHYNYFRDYDPTIGRYVQSDPIGLEGGINTYTYVEGNPLGRVDPTGKISAPGWIVIAAGAVIGGYITWDAYTCARDASNDDFLRATRGGWARFDKRVHCVVSCEITRRCGSNVARDAGWGREVYQLFVQGDITDRVRRQDSIEDERANRYGRSCPPAQDCYAYCNGVY